MVDEIFAPTDYRNKYIFYYLYTNFYNTGGDIKENSIKKEKTKNILTAWKLTTNTAMSSQKRKHRQGYLSEYVKYSIG